MSAKHTPAPWMPLPMQMQGLPYTPVIAGTLIAKVYSTAYGDHEQSQANARLMAAAPDMLDALEGLLNALPSATTHPSVAQARRALAKARGES